MSREQTLVNKTACVMVPMLSCSCHPSWQGVNQSHQGHNNGRKKVFQKDITLTTQDMAESRINFPAISSWFQTRAILKTLFKQRPVPFRSLSPFQTKSNYVRRKIWYVCKCDPVTVTFYSYCKSLVGIDLGTTYVILYHSLHFSTSNWLFVIATLALVSGKTIVLKSLPMTRYAFVSLSLYIVMTHHQKTAG